MTAMREAAAVGWFICGLAGMHIGILLDHGIRKEDASAVWCVLLGPILLAWAVMTCIVLALDGKDGAQ